MKNIISYIVPFCFLVLMFAPGIGGCENQQINRLAIVLCLLLFCRKIHDFKTEAHHWLFFAWLLWAALGTIFSDYQAMSFYGFYPYRGDGLLTYLIITCMAVLYWMNFKTLKPLAGMFIIAFVIAIGAYFYFVTRWYKNFPEQGAASMFFGRFFLPEVGIGSFACQASIITAILNPLFAFLGLIVLIEAKSRIGLIAWAITLSLASLYRYRKYLTKKRFLGIICLLGTLFLLFECVKGKLPISTKFTYRPDVMKLGMGARSQWLLQGSNLSRSMPLTGFGLDTLSEYLHEPRGKELVGYSELYSDRTHNIAMDSILQTGWIGFTLILLTLGGAIGITWFYPTRQNVVCLGVLGAFLIYGMANPHGIVGNLTALTCLFGIRRTE